MKLILEQVQKSFGDKQVLKEATAEFVQGKVTALLGRNGAGKTTLFSLIARERTVSGGRIAIEEGSKIRPVVPEDVFFMVSEPRLPNFLTGRELLEFFIEANRKKFDVLPDIEEAFAQIDFAVEDRDRLIHTYSTGMKNKLQMMMFLLLRPPVILMDEPLTSLDVVVQHEMKQLIRGVRSEHIILFSTHILQLARDLCDDIVLLRDGRLRPIHEELDQPDVEERVIRLLTEDVDAEEEGRQ